MNIQETPPALPPPAVRLPLARPVVTNVLLGLIAVAFVAETLLGGSTRTRVLVNLGAQVNLLVAAGEHWRLLTAMFLHIGLAHLAFNGWALFSLGRDVEAFYGPRWFAAIYGFSGLAGNLAYYLLGPNNLSAGASGAIFGLIGAETAFFLRNRSLFGRFGRERLANLALLIGINLVFGFTVAGINNLAHLGGLVTGFALGWLLAPRYQFRWTQLWPLPAGALFDITPARRRWLTLGGAAVLLVAALWLGNLRWAYLVSLYDAL